MIEYFIDGSTKNNMIGAGVVKVNEFGFIEKYHFNVEHQKPSSHIAEGYSLEKALEMILEKDVDSNELINIYTDNQNLHRALVYNENTDFNSSDFFAKQVTNNYYHHLRKLYLKLISRYTNSPIYHCNKTKESRPKIKIYFKDSLEDKRYLQDAHLLSREYINEEVNSLNAQLKAIRKNNKWYIHKDNKGVIAVNKRPLIALSMALETIDNNIKDIKLCEKLQTLIKTTNKNKLSSGSMKSAVKIIEKHIN
ncbi:ribonuclease H family protein [Rossellomorea aquimaris]|uniref:hypothetical protein n=1 Tax=Rossellomorea aquimaris TaxID=189382 RepID=UPI0007D090D1|nr:hypothetical protein [Rossellomorea aquimaris]